MSSLQRKIMNRFPASPFPPVPPRKPGPGGRYASRDFSPVHWSKYFQNKETLDIGGGSAFCVYRSSNTTSPGSATVYFLHGGGFSGLTWSLAIENLMEIVECHVVAVDLRGHGETTTSSDYNLTTQQMVEDLIQVARAMNLGEGPIVLVGHSLGGALAVNFAAELKTSGEFNVVGLVVIDVVEGSALESLATMNVVLRNRPSSFPNISKSIEWCVKSGQVRNIESARVSMPGQIKNSVTNEPATLQITDPRASSTSAPTQASSDVSNEESNTNPVDSVPASFLGQAPLRPDVITEEETEETLESPFLRPQSLPPSVPTATSLQGDSFTWRIDLGLTQPHWTDWFQGLSQKFLELPCPKLLLLAGVDRLDRELTVGQMQGKFQMQVLPNVGHAVHEDSPFEVAQSIASFLVRHKLVIGKVDSIPTVFPGC